MKHVYKITVLIIFLNSTSKYSGMFCPILFHLGACWLHTKFQHKKIVFVFEEKEVLTIDSIIKQCIHVPNYQNVPHKDLQICPNKIKLNKCHLPAITLISESTVLITDWNLLILTIFPDNYWSYFKILRSSLFFFPLWRAEQIYELTRKSSS
jgi:hypothetical protein